MCQNNKEEFGIVSEVFFLGGELNKNKNGQSLKSLTSSLGIKKRKADIPSALH
jgi:hypothetical protein